MGGRVGGSVRHTRVFSWLATVGTISCLPPPPLDLGREPLEVTEPTIEILYPEQEQLYMLDESCTLDVPIVVYVQNYELVPPNPNEPVEEGKGHWHGGLYEETGYCTSAVALCEGGDGSEPFARYDGRGMKVGSITL